MMPPLYPAMRYFKAEVDTKYIPFFCSVRAIRVLSFNARWEAKLEKRRQRQEAKAARLKKLEEERAAKEREDEARRKKNPFTSSGTKIGSFGGGIFGNETNPFASVTSAPKEAAGEETSHPVTYDHESDDESAEDEEDTLAEELAMKASIESSERQGPDWAKEAPAYLPAQYLNTYAEPSSSARTYEESKESKAQLKKLKESGGIGEMKGWEAERYESMMVAGIDETFERFVKRVSPHGKQVVRYEFGGIPLPFHAKGPVYNKLWVPNWPTSTTVSGQAFKNTIKDASRVYSSDAISPCSACGSRRVFELQLMPNLVNTLRPSSIVGGQQGEEGEEEKDAEKRKRREIEEAIGHKLPDKPDSDGITRSKPWKDQTPSKLASRSGLQWSTAMVFVCEKDCRGSKSSKGEIWSEEVVELQFEHE